MRTQIKLPKSSAEKPTVLFENPDFLVINKPAGWYSIPAREPKASDLVVTDWIRNELGTEPWVVHRLDRFTTGVMVLARSKTAHSEGNRWFEKRLVKKTYLFIAAPLPAGMSPHGPVPASALPGRPAIQIKTPVDGKPSQTLFEVISKSEKIFLGRATPMTGRFHQIREHAREGRFPLLGDHSYGFDAKVAGIDFHRVALHAFELTLPFAKVQAPLPSDMKNLIDELGLKS